MTKLSNQEIFDKALFGIRKAGYVRSYDKEQDRGQCMYRSGSNACHIGLCISDEDATVWDKNLTVSGKPATGIDSIANTLPESFNKYFDRSQIEFLESLQYIHDTWANFKDSYEKAMKSLAENYSLVYTEV